jgi:threonine dehydratase
VNQDKESDGWARRIQEAWRVVSDELPPTPLVSSTGLRDGAMLKLENFQPTGSFKVRGAWFALSRLHQSALSPSQSGISRRVITASTGNHALATAFVAARLGTPATVVVPATVSEAKLRSLRALSAEVIAFGDDYESAERHATDLAEAGAHYLSPYNDPDIIAGQATLGTELLRQLDGPFTVVCSVGAGALASGLGLAASQTDRMTVVGVESVASPAVSAAVRAGRVVPVEIGRTLADGIAGNLAPDSITVGLVRAHVAGLVAVTDEEITAAIRYLAREHGIVAEGAGAAPVAAILAGKVNAPGPMVPVVGGRNIALQTLARVLAGETSDVLVGSLPD